MKIKLLVVGKTDHKGLQAMISEYQKRLQHYIKFELEVIPALKSTKNLSIPEQLEKEGEAILARIGTTDVMVLLDEQGKQYPSIDFANYLQKFMNAGTRQLVFVVGGPYGFSNTVYIRSQDKISLSAMTFSHQMVRLFFVEQLYRGFTILRNEPYHHQ
ncbi:23S rRNA (pseudouridine(1915)-N(3))-methyltransferase RlmH [Muriicola sp.]|uniref:23S rRNA (pseudouridine(1915)-N(3))-methyltransferase RlmH n=1 Tax=Muriicola sp. TaxID=2020856 RepID=UPI003C738A77